MYSRPGFCASWACTFEPADLESLKMLFRTHIGVLMQNRKGNKFISLSVWRWDLSTNQAMFYYLLIYIECMLLRQHDFYCCHSLSIKLQLSIRWPTWEATYSPSALSEPLHAVGSSNSWAEPLTSHPFKVKKIFSNALTTWIWLNQ